MIQRNSIKAGCQPKEVMQAAIKLTNLEKQSSGKTHPETLAEFQTLTRKISELNQKLLKLTIDVDENKKQRAQTLKRAKMSENEIANINKLKLDLRYYGISLFNVERL